MAFYLKLNFNDNNEKIQLTNPIPILDGYEVESVLNYNGVGGNTKNWLYQNDQNRVYFTPDRVALEVNNVIVFSDAGALTPYLGSPNLFRLKRVGDTYSVEAEDGTVLVSLTVEGAPAFSPSVICMEGALRFIQVDFYSSRVYSSGTLIHEYLPTGSGSVIPDTAGTNDADVVGLIGDDSEYVFYSALTPSQGTVAPNTSLTWTTDLVGITEAFLEDSELNQYSLTSVTDTGGFLPDLSGGLSACLFGDVSLKVSNGTETADAPITLEAPAGYEVITLTSVPVTPLTTDWVFDFDTPAVVGDQGVFLTSSSYEYRPDGTTGNITQGQDTFFTVQASNGDVSEITKIFEGDVVTPEGGKIPLWRFASELKQQGFEGSVNDVLSNWLSDQGFEGNLNDKWIAYWESLSLEGSYNDKLSSWRKQ